MASLHRDPRGKSPFWYCAFTEGDGKRRFKSTKQTKHKNALTVCSGWQRAADLARKGTLTQVQALKVVSEIYERTNEEPLASASTVSFLRDWIAAKKLTAAPATARRYGDVVEAFISHLGDKAKRNLSGLTPNDVAGFRDAGLKAGKSNATADMCVKVLRVALNTARKRGMILSNPAEAVDSLPKVAVDRKPFTRDQIAALLKVASNEWRGMVLLGACHGLRLMDAARLTWANVDLERGALRFRPMKTRRSVQKGDIEIPLHPDVEEYLLGLRIKSRKLDTPIFPKLSRKKAQGRSGLSGQFADLLATAGIDREPGIKKPKGEGRQVHQLSFHSFRHTAISEMANSGVSKERRMKLADHKSNVHEAYTHHDLEALRSDVERVKSFTKPKDPT